MDDWARAQIETLRQRVDELERRVAGLTGEPFADLAEAAQSDPEVVALVRDGRDMEAIRLYIAKVGGGLKEAKEAIERMKV